jgi:hypothetical protein
VNVFVQRPRDGLFLNGLSEWRPRKEAYDFGRVGFAAEFCVARPLRGVRIIVELDGNPKHHVALEVLPTEDETPNAQARRVINGLRRRHLRPKCRKAIATIGVI